MIRPVSSMQMGPAPSILGMPVNLFFLEEGREPERRLKLSSLRGAFCQMVFEAKFKKRMLLKPRTFYKHMRWAEQLSNLFLDFFDWGRNIEVAIRSRNEETYEMLKGIEARIQEKNDKKR